MAQTQTITVNVRVDENVKRNVESLFESMGMNISTAVNMFFRQCLLEEAIPFQPRGNRREVILEKGRKALREAQNQAVLNGTSELTLDEINEMIKECRAEEKKASCAAL